MTDTSVTSILNSARPGSTSFHPGRDRKKFPPNGVGQKRGIHMRQEHYQTRHHFGQESIGFWAPLCLKVHLALLSLLFALPLASAQERSERSDMRPQIEAPEPGVRLLGQPSRFSELKVGNVFLPSPDGRYLYLGIGGKLLKVDVENLETESETITQLTYIQKIAAAPNGQLAVIGYRSPPLDPDNPVALPLVLSCILFDKSMEIDRVIEFPKSEDANNEFLVSLRFSPDGKDLLVIGQQITRLIDVDSGKILVSHNGLFDEKGLFLDDGLIFFPRIGKVWNTISNKVSGSETLKGMELPQRNSYILIHDTEPVFAFSNANDESIKLVNHRLGKTLMSIEAEDLQLYQGDFSSDGKWLIASCYARDFRSTALAVFNLQDKKLEAIARFKSQRFLLPSFVGENSILLYDYNTSRLSQIALNDALSTNLQIALNQPAATNQITVNHDGTRTVCNYGRQDIDMETGDVDSDHPQFSRRVFFGVQDQLVRSLDNEAIHIEPPRGSKRVFGLPKETRVVAGLLSLLGSTETENSSGYTMVVDIGLDHDGKKLTCLYAQSQNNQLHYVQWDARTSKTLFQDIVPIDPAKQPSAAGLITAINPDGQNIYFLNGNQLHCMDVESGDSKTVKEFEVVPHQLQFNHDGSLLAMIVHGKTPSESQVQVFQRDEAELELVFAADGQLFDFANDSARMAIASQNCKKPVRILNTKNWEEVVKHETHHSNRMALGLSGDGRRLVFSLDDSRMEIWDLDELN